MNQLHELKQFIRSKEQQFGRSVASRRAFNQALKGKIKKRLARVAFQARNDITMPRHFQRQHLTGGATSYNRENKHSVNQQRYFTPDFIIDEAMNAIRTHVPKNINILLDLGAGNAFFGERFSGKTKRRAISVDTIPAWKTRSTITHTKKKADALTFRLPANVDPKRVIGGFNPPYGHKNMLAKKFVRRAYDMECAYGIWLVPQLMKGYVTQFYHILYQKDYHRLNLFRSASKENTSTPNPQWVCLILGRRRTEPNMNVVPPSLKSGGFTSRAFVPNKTTFIVRILGGKSPFPIFARSGKKWIMYNYENDRKGKLHQVKEVVTCKMQPASRSYKTTNHYSAVGGKHAVMVTQSGTSYVVGGNAFVKFSESLNTKRIASKLFKKASDHVLKLSQRATERKRIKDWNDPVKEYRHMNRLYRKKSAIEMHFVSYQPQRILPSTIIKWVRKWG